MWRETAPDSGGGGAPQLGASRGRRPMAAAPRADVDAQQRTDRELAAQLEPWQELFPPSGVHAHLATAPALAAPNRQ